MKVEIYGKCGHSLPHEKLEENMKFISERYKFYLALENSICDDYITEEPFIALNYNIVPIVLGVADYNNYLPPSSFINPGGFKSIEALGRYINSMSLGEYLNFFDWKGKYKIINNRDVIARGNAEYICHYFMQVFDICCYLC